MTRLQHMWLIALKDLKIFAKDRATVFFFIVFPFLFIFIFNIVLQGVGGEDERLEIHLATRETAGLSQQLLGAMETKDETALKPGDPRLIWDKSYAESRASFDSGNLSGFIAFPEDFTTALAAGKGAIIEIYADAGNAFARAALNGLATALATELGTQEAIINASVTLLIEGGALSPDEASINRLVQQIMREAFSGAAAGAETAAVTFKTEKVGEVEAENPSNFVIPGYLVMFVFFAAAIASELIVRERLNNTLERLLATSVRRESILGGIYLGTALRGLVQIVIFWGAGILIFKVDLGLSPAAVFTLSILMVLMSAAFSLMLATLVKTRRAAGSLANITALVMAPLGGCWWPLFLYPEWLQTIARITPHAWATTGFSKIMVFGADFGAAIPEMLALFVFSLIFGGIAIWRFRTSAV